MFLIWIGILSIIALLFLLIFRSIISKPPPPPLQPPKPLPKETLDCDISRYQQMANTAAPVTPGLTGGEFKVNTFTVTGNNRLDRSLTLVTNQDLTVEGDITIPNFFQQPGNPSVNVTLVSLNGRVTIAGSAIVGGTGNAAPAQDQDVQGKAASARTEAGTNGGYVKIVGSVIDVQGQVYGCIGGDGGKALARGQAEVVAGVAREGSATAIAGCGGYGGDVLLCAVDMIGIRSTAVIRAASGGSGGKAEARADNGQDGIARAGDGGEGGDVRIASRDPNVSCGVIVEPQAIIEGGNGGEVSEAIAYGGDGAATGKPDAGAGRATGGTGGKGGTVIFQHCRVSNGAGEVAAGDGGEGGRGKASGGLGENGTPSGYRGGNAYAYGGQGGKTGTQPEWTDVNGNLIKGKNGSNEAGGSAIAKTGNGGSGQGPNGRGGWSGEGTARGGPSADGQPANEEVSQSAAPNGRDGGPGEEIQSPGAGP